MDEKLKKQTMMVWNVLSILIGNFIMILGIRYSLLNLSDDVNSVLTVIMLIAGISILVSIFNIVATFVNKKQLKTILYIIVGGSIMLIFFSIAVMFILEMEFLDILYKNQIAQKIFEFEGKNQMIYFGVFKNIPLFLIAAIACNIIVAEKIIGLINCKIKNTEDVKRENLKKVCEKDEIELVQEKIEKAKKEIELKRLENEYSNLVKQIEDEEKK